jgi:BirA family biotin operon repressor/biotin-[acetyl-CoA-carboxylase] ligase
MSYRDLDRPPLDARALQAALVVPGGFWTDVVVTSSTASTNADLADVARVGAAEGSVHTTDHQVAGRGRLDRTWESPEASGIAVSVLLRPIEVPAGRWVWLPLLVGLAVAATVEECGIQAGLKWPNDVEVDGRKIAGILLERLDTSDGPAAVVGVGVNVSMRADELPVDTATSLLLEDASETDRTVVLRLLLRNLEALYRAWRGAGGDPAAGVRESYVRRCVTIGSDVSVAMPDGSALKGRAEDIDDLGRLVVGGIAVSAGDITHVRPDSSGS